MFHAFCEVCLEDFVVDTPESLEGWYFDVLDEGGLLTGACPECSKLFLVFYADPENFENLYLLGRRGQWLVCEGCGKRSAVHDIRQLIGWRLTYLESGRMDEMYYEDEEQDFILRGLCLGCEK